MKKVKYWWLIIAVVIASSLSLSSCKDDDDDKDGGSEAVVEDPSQETRDAAASLFVLMNQLADVDSLPEQWETAEFEPTIGRVVDASQPYVRAMAVQNIRSARDVFRSLIGENFDETLSTVTWQCEGVGTLVFNELNQADCVATIDVRLPQMPHLTQLRLLPPSAFGDNAMKYDTYYRIGDVVEDKDGCCWICVRSAGGPDKKEKTHWVSMQLLTDNSKASGFKSNVKTITTKGHAIQVPQNLGGTEVKHLKYFAQLMYLLQRPDEYAQQCQPGGVLEGGLGDLGTTDADGEAISPKKFKQIAMLWDKLDIWSHVLPKSITKDYFLSNDVRIIYNGHSNATFGSSINLYVCSMTGVCNSEQHLSTPSWDKKDATKEFDVTEYALRGRATKSNINGIANANGQAIVVRMCTGKELADNLMFQPDYYERITNVKNQLVTRFRTKPFSPYYRIGDVFKDDQGSRWMVIRSSGIFDPDSCQHSAPYSLLVSFDNIQASADKHYATNLPKRDLAIEAMSMMLYLCLPEIPYRTDPDRLDDWADPNTTKMSQIAMHNFYTYAGVDMTWLFDYSSSPQGNREAFIHTCFAYDDGTTGQKLMRYTQDTYEAGNHTCNHFWERYPLSNMTHYEAPNREQFFSENGDSKLKIMLEDIAYQDMVNTYASDYFATRPFVLDEEGTGIRAPRSKADDRAKDVTNYFYDRKKMQSRSLPLSMWNEPVLFFRAVKLFDNGEDDYEKTIDGHKLTPLKKEPYDSNPESLYWINASSISNLPLSVMYNFTWITGSMYRLPIWLD